MVTLTKHFLTLKKNSHNCVPQIVEPGFPLDCFLLKQNVKKYNLRLQLTSKL